MSSKYDPLVSYLVAQPDDRVQLSLAEIETIIGAPLPVGARGRKWWTKNPGRTMVRPLVQAAGWRIVLDAFWGRHPVVTFVRDGSDATAAGRA